MVTGTVRGGWRGRSRNWKSLSVMACSSCLRVDGDGARKGSIVASPGPSPRSSPRREEKANVESRYLIWARSCRAPQLVGQRGQARRFGLDQPELVLQP